MTAPRALVLGTLAGQVDLMVALRDRGWEVHACGHAEVGPGVELADHFHLVDILDVDAVTELARSIDAGLVYSVGSDIAMPTIARVATRLGLPRLHDVGLTDLLQDKARLRDALADTPLAVQSWSVAHGVALPEPDRWPVIVKPTDSQGQRGITVVAERAELDAAVAAAQSASRTRGAIVEEVLTGPEVSVHVLVVDGEVRWTLVSDRLVWDGPMVGIPAAHRVPARAARGHEDAIAALVDRLVGHLQVRTGPLYVQLFLTPTGPRVVEVASRLDGCHLWRLVEEALGLNLLDAVIDLLLTGTWEPPAGARAVPYDLTLGFLLGPPDVPYEPVDHPTPSAPALRHLEPQVVPGSRPRAVNDVVARLGYWIAETSGLEGVPA